MIGVLRVRNLATLAAALLLTAASLGATAFFADRPGSDLRPVGGAGGDDSDPPGQPERPLDRTLSGSVACVPGGGLAGEQRWQPFGRVGDRAARRWLGRCHRVRGEAEVDRLRPRGLVRTPGTDPTRLPRTGRPRRSSADPGTCPAAIAWTSSRVTASSLASRSSTDRWGMPANSSRPSLTIRLLGSSMARASPHASIPWRARAPRR